MCINPRGHRKRKGRKEGIEVIPAVVKELKEIAQKLNMDFKI